MKKIMIILAALSLVCFIALLGIQKYNTGNSSLATVVRSILPRVVAKKPNIVFVLVDDLDISVMNKMPKLKDALNKAGMTFNNQFVSLSLCCPSRSAILCGQYGHNNGVLTNDATNTDGTTGAFNAFTINNDQDKSIGVVMQNANYHTALFGKYLNGYNLQTAGLAAQKGWDEWAVPVEGDPYNEYNFTLNANGNSEDHYLANCPKGTLGCQSTMLQNTYQDKNLNYMTNVLQTKSLDFIKNQSNSSQPFFLYLATYAPHYPATTGPDYEHFLSGTSTADIAWRTNYNLGRNQAYNEADISDKPAWMYGAPLIGANQYASLNLSYQKRIAAMYSVQDLVLNLIDTLKATGQLDNTYIVFTSDNGYHLGEHRLSEGKLTAFDTDLHVPLIVRGPGIIPGSQSDLLTGNIDFAPTFAEIGAATPVAEYDGRSMLPILAGNTVTGWRNSFLLEHGPASAFLKMASTSVSGTFEPADGVYNKLRSGAYIGYYSGLRTNQYTYVNYATSTDPDPTHNGFYSSEEELYDDLADPFQLNNLVKSTTTDPTLIAKLRNQTAALSTCKGDSCRSADQ